MQSDLDPRLHSTHISSRPQVSDRLTDRVASVREPLYITLYITLYFVSCFTLFAACETVGVATSPRDEQPDRGRVIPVASDAQAINYLDEDVIEADPCDPNPCPNGERCETEERLGDMGVSELIARCVQRSCDELMCLAGQRCEDRPEGGVCVDTGCLGPEGCAPQEYCDASGACVPDVCQPGERACEGDAVTLCEPDGSGFTPWVSCPQGSDQCISPIAGDAACACLDDWDCPDYQRCDRGACRGRISRQLYLGHTGSKCVDSGLI